MKKFRRVVCILLTMVMLTALAPQMAVKASADVDTNQIIRSRIDDLYDKLRGKYFTTDQMPASGSDDQRTSNNRVIQQRWFKDLFQVEDLKVSQFPETARVYAQGKSCAGFATFAGWYIFKNNNEDRITSSNISKKVSFNKSEVSKLDLQVGDFISLWKASGSGHECILVELRDSGIYVLDSNYNTAHNNAVTMHEISFSGSQYNKIRVARCNQRNNVSGNIEKRKMSLSGEVYPSGTYSALKSFGLRGIFSSGSTITRISAYVRNVDGRDALPVYNKSWNSTVYNIRTDGINDHFLFQNLDPGKYTYHVEAADSAGDKAWIDSSFEITGAVTSNTVDSYEKSVYYWNLVNTNLSGNPRLDIVNIAISQIGYHEGNNAKELAGLNTSGSGNYTVYTKEVAKTNGAPWCAYFVSWCARKANISERVIHTTGYAACDDFGCTWRGRSADRKVGINYTPQLGDLIIFDWKANGYVTKEPASNYGDHVGIVTKVDSTRVYTVEGNTSNNKVEAKSYLLNDESIKGYAVPNYDSSQATKKGITIQDNTNITATRTLHTLEDVYGTVSATGNITRVEAGIYRASDNTALFFASADNIGSHSFNYRSSFNDKLEFDKIEECGAYYYKVSAWAEGCEPASIRKDFQVVRKDIPTYTVTFAGNGGSPASSQWAGKQGQSVDLSTVAVPGRKNYIFQGWAYEENAQSAVYGSTGSFTPGGSITLYAVWKMIEKPNVPSLNARSVDIAAGHSARISWWAADRADSYTVSICDAGDTEVYTTTTSGTEAAAVLSEPGKYTVKVKASNVAGETAWSQSGTIIVHAPLTVTFRDYNGTEIIQQVDYGCAAVAPKAPSREGYTFTGWEGGELSNVRENLVLTAKYDAIKYTVTFLDCNGDVAQKQTVTYDGDTPGSAVEPDDAILKLPQGYIRIGWNTDEWQHVTRDGIVVSPCYTWERTTLPITVTIDSTSASDDGDGDGKPDGYWIQYTVTNHVDKGRTGRTVVAMKTPSGKFIANTESGAFYLGGGKTYSGNIFVPVDVQSDSAYDDVYTVELYVVDKYSNMTPISSSAFAHIYTAANSEWGPWMTAEEYNAYSGDKSVTETKTEYRTSKRDVTDWISNTSYADWQRLDSRTVKSGWSGWSGWQDGYVASSDNCEVETQQVVTANAYTEYRYGRWRSTNCSKGTWSHFNDIYAKKLYGGTWYEDYTAWSTSRVSLNDYNTDWGSCSYNDSKGHGHYSGGAYKWNRYVCGKDYFWEESRYNPRQEKTQYRYRTRYDINQYRYYKWQDWSDWSASQANENDNLRVESRKLYRVKVSTISGVDGGYSVSGRVSGLDNPNGREAILTIFKVDQASDYSNEYITQGTLGANGEYSFHNIFTRETPSRATGDFTATLTIEGCEGALFIDTGDTFKAPKQTYNVEFMVDGKPVGQTQTIIEGETAMAPANPEKDGYIFLGWDKNYGNVREHLTVNAVLVPKTYTVVFVDKLRDTIWMAENIRYGEAASDDSAQIDADPIEGYSFVGWETAEGLDLNHVTSNMIATAKYQKAEYTVKFCDADGSVISEQSIPYGEAAQAPAENLVHVPEGMRMTGWNTSDYQCVTAPMIIAPALSYLETAQEAIVSLESGTYVGTQAVSIEAQDGEEILYSLVTSKDDSGNKIVYTEPIEITESSILTVITNAENRNSTDTVFEYVIVPDDSVPGAPSNVNVTADEKQVTLTWDEVSGADGYVVYKNDEYNNEERFMVTTNSFTDNNVTAINDYTYSVAAYKMLNNGTSSTMMTTEEKLPSVNVRFYGDKYAVRSITVTAPESELVVGSSVRLSAAVIPENAYDTDVVWSVQPGTGKAEISEDGVFTALSAGTVTVTAAAQDGSGVTGSLELNLVNATTVGAATLKVSSATVRKDGTFTIDVSLSKNSKAEMIQFALLYDAKALKFMNAEPGALMLDKAPTMNGADSGVVYFNWDSTDPLTDGGVLMQVEFQAISETALQTVIEIPVNDANPDNIFILMAFGEGTAPKDIPCDVLNGKASIVDVILGDVNGDGAINVIDSNLIRRAAAKLGDLTDIQNVAADVNRDGKINVLDANLIRRYAAKLITSFDEA